MQENVAVRKLELEELVRMFQHEAETHAQVRKTVPHKDVPQTAEVRRAQSGSNNNRSMFSRFFRF
ncbi:hypothetical protein PIB30_114385 [Stylosanthes scabra]|uniref:Uncharacterized protein n=1 Tax=Stylosanthes scabra TaxID=79078 RepID=A0ABU6U0L5_9FABA|nr:hypothetical protein [Stylosanthes scabra]